MRVIESAPGTENLCCCFHPSNNNFIAVGNNRGILQIYNVSTGKALKVDIRLTDGLEQLVFVRRIELRD